MGEAVILLCVRVLPDDDPELVSGSTQDECGNCKHAIWVAPSSRLIVRHEGALLLCTECGIAAIEEDPAPKYAVREAQKAELRRHLRERKGRSRS